MTVRTLKKKWRELRLLISWYIAHKYTQMDINFVRQYLKSTILPAEKLTYKSREKSIAAGRAVGDILFFLWELDEHVFRHPRVRLQLSTLILLMRFMGSRPGELVESAAHSGLNEGLHWGDINFELLVDRDGTPCWVAHIRIRNRKGKRGQEDKDVIEHIREDKSIRIICPISALLALGLADEAFAEIATVDKLRAMIAPPAGCRVVSLSIKPEKRELPVFRCVQEGGISSSRILQNSTLSRDLAELGRRAGYVQTLRPYSIRRGYGKDLDQKSADGARQRGHLSVLLVKCLKRRRSEHHGWPSDQELIDFFTTMQPNLHACIPLPPGALLRHGRFKRTTSYEPREGFDEQPKSVATLGTAAGLPFDAPLERPPPSRLLLSFLRYDRDRAQAIRQYAASRAGDKVSLGEMVGALRLLARPGVQDLSYPMALHGSEALCETRSRNYLITTASSLDANALPKPKRSGLLHGITYAIYSTRACGITATPLSMSWITGKSVNISDPIFNSREDVYGACVEVCYRRQGISQHMSSRSMVSQRKLIILQSPNTATNAPSTSSLPRTGRRIALNT
ncbi:hypothetical protein LTR95_015454 [Oleoguttula sp. CCFEE 5521]